MRRRGEASEIRRGGGRRRRFAWGVGLLGWGERRESQARRTHLKRAGWVSGVVLGPPIFTAIYFKLSVLKYFKCLNKKLQIVPLVKEMKYL
jgi:hypothetical protein